MMKEVLRPAQIRARLMAALLAPEGLLVSQQVLARRAGIHKQTAVKYLKDGRLRAEAERRLQEPVQAEDVAAVERALLARAKEGSVAAAKLLFGRLGLAEGAEVPAETPALVAEIRRLVDQADDDNDNEG
jgi:hypothetical protein